MRKLALLFGVLMVAGSACAGPEGMLNPGEKFPAWQLVDSTGKPVSSQDLAGKTYLLWFFPRAMTSGCTAEGCSLRDNYAAFEKLKVEVLGVSFDSPERNAEFIEKNHFPFSLLSDTHKTLAVEVGAADDDKRLFARRISYLVGPDGKVIKAYNDVDPSTHAAQVLGDLSASK
jgi:thioredoxin-dependent peroxiredoxin